MTTLITLLAISYYLFCLGFCMNRLENAEYLSPTSTKIKPLIILFIILFSYILTPMILGALISNKLRDD